MTKTGQRLVPKRGNSLKGFTAYKSYEVISGTGEENLSKVAFLFNNAVHSENTANVVDDEGNIRFISLEFFREFNLEMGNLFV